MGGGRVSRGEGANGATSREAALTQGEGEGGLLEGRGSGGGQLAVAHQNNAAESSALNVNRQIRTVIRTVGSAQDENWQRKFAEIKVGCVSYRCTGSQITK